MRPTNEQIVRIVASGRPFLVSWRYRDSGLRTRCAALARKGILKRDWANYEAGSDRYVAGPLAKR